MNMKATDLQCEFNRNPLAIGTSKPRLSWKLNGGISKSQEGRQILYNKNQTAYRILVYHFDDKGKQLIIWDSEKVPSNRSTFIRYKGKSLQSRMKYYWKVKVWDEDGE